MALQRALETTRPRSSRLFDDPLARDFLRGPLRAVADLATLPVAGRIVPVLYDLIWPGPRPSAVARTRLIDDTLAEALADGITQVVLLGAGFDSRAWRLPPGGSPSPGQRSPGRLASAVCSSRSISWLNGRPLASHIFWK